MKDKINKLKDFLVKNKKISIAAAVALVVVIIGVIVLCVSCGGDDNNGKADNGETTTGVGDENDETKTCTIKVRTAGGMVFEGNGVYVYESSSLEDLVAFAKTDENGEMTFEGKGDVTRYAVVIEDIPEGYKKDDYFKMTGENTEIVLETEILPLEDMANTSFDLGSVIKDFTVTTPDGTEVTISKLLEEKKAIVLNFFYLKCQPCKNEFPYLQEAYTQYSDDVAVIALTPVDKDDAAIAEFAKELGLTFYVAQCDSQWEQMMDISAYPTTVVIDRYGVISFMHTGSVPSTETFVGLFAYYAADDYKQILTKDIDDIVNYEASEGTADNPVGILPDAEGFEATLAAGEERYFEIPKISDLIIEINDADAYIIYEETKYEAVDGVLTVTVSAPDPYTPAVFILGNKGTSEKTFTATFGAVEGSMANPIALNIGEFTANTKAGNELGVFYTYTATESGTLTVKLLEATAGVEYDFVLYNLTTYVYHNFSTDGQADKSLSIEVSQGDMIQFSVGTLPNAENEIPAADYKFEAAFTTGEGATEEVTKGNVTYSVTVTDNNGNGLSGVTVAIDSTEVTTNSSGVAKATLQSGSYAVRVTAPSGYKYTGGTITVTADSPSVTVKLSKYSTTKQTYTVKVVDENNKAIKGVTVVVGDSYGTTDSNGSVSFSLLEDNYSAVISMPSGYTASSTTFSFNGGTSVTIKLKKGSSGETPTVSNTASYTVNVVDYKNKGQSGVMVMFYSGSNVVAMQQTNSSGAATVQLEKGNYTVQLSGLGTKGYDSTNLSLTSSKTSISVMVAETGKKTASIYDIERYAVTTGATYVEVEPNGNYPGLVVFEPTQTGKYKVTLSNSTTALSYYGSNTSFISDQTSSLSVSNNSYTLNVKYTDSTHIIGLGGTENCIVIIERVGDAEYTNADLEAMMDWTDYTGTDKISKYTLGSGKTLTYVDITASTSTYTLAYNSSDGYYHLGTANGPVMLVQLGTGAPYIALSDVIGFTGSGGSNFGKYIYNSSGTLVKKENYTSLLWKYMENMDDTYKVYPLTKDLMYMLQNGGEYRGWWASSGRNNVIYQKTPKLNSEIAWMFACCYVK